MSMTTLFSVANLTVMPFWLLMIAAPRWPVTARLVRSPLILVATLLAGPLGLLAYLGVLAVRRGRAGAVLRDLVGKASEESPSLMRLAAASVALLTAALIAQVFDPRLVLGASVWAKPAKFGASVALTAVTLGLLLRHLDLPARGRRWAVALISWLTGLELVLITLQSIRGVPSHFNAATPFDVAVFAAMGAGIAIVTLAIGYLAYRAFRTPFATNRALGWGIRLGLVTMLFGASMGGLMPPPTAAQKARLATGEHPALIGAHTVGAPDGGPGLPVTRWSTGHGDLRVPHFVGLHALQLLPLAGWLLGRRRRRDGAALTVIAGAGYLGLTITTLVEALRGRPLLSPDGVTLALGGATLIACAIAAVVVLRRARPQILLSERTLPRASRGPSGADRATAPGVAAPEPGRRARPILSATSSSGSS